MAREQMVLQLRDGGDVKAMVEVLADGVIVQTLLGPQVFTAHSIAQVATRLLELIRIKSGKGMVG